MICSESATQKRPSKVLRILCIINIVRVLLIQDAGIIFNHRLIVSAFVVRSRYPDTQTGTRGTKIRFTFNEWSSKSGLNLVKLADTLVASNDTAATTGESYVEEVSYENIRYTTNKLNNGNNGCVVELIEPETQCIVRLVGVFHGSQSSAHDVQHFALSSNVLVLELCPDRYRDLILKNPSNVKDNEISTTIDENLLKSISSDGEATSNDSGSKRSKVFFDVTPTTGPHSISWIEKYANVVGDAANKQGWGTAIVVAIFGLVNGLQHQILGLQPGLEFVTASNVAKKYSIPIVLADQDVTITLQRISQIPQISKDLWYKFFQTKSWDKTFGPAAHSLLLALFGGSMGNLNDWQSKDSPIPQNLQLVTLPQFLTRSKEAIQDLMKFFVFPFVLIGFFNMGIGFTEQTTTEELNPVIVMIDNFIVFILFYLSIALPAAKVILMERDTVLTAGVKAACLVAKQVNHITMEQKVYEQNNFTEGTFHETPYPRNDVVVVVILGLLHVNGVATLLSQIHDHKATT